MSENPEIQNSLIDQEQKRLDKLDGHQDNFVQNQYLTALFMKRVDVLQAALDDRALDPVFEEDMRNQLWKFLCSNQEDLPLIGKFGTLLDKLESVLVSSGPLDSEKPISPEKSDMREWVKMTEGRLRSELKIQLKDKSKLIDEHYLELLSYPKDEKIIREIFERMVVYRYNTNNVGQSRFDSALIEPRIFLGDFHPFHLAFMAKSIGVPDDFQFTVYEHRPLKDDSQLHRGKAHTTMTFGDLIAYEKGHVLTDVSLEDGRTHHDDEWFLLLLNLEGVDGIVGINLNGKAIRKQDVVDSVIREFSSRGNAMETRDNFKKYDWRLIGATFLNDVTNDINVLNNTVRTLKANRESCENIHAAEALLGCDLISKSNKRLYADIVFKNMFIKYLDFKTLKYDYSGYNSLSGKVRFLGHSLEVYSEYGQYFTAEQKKVFSYMIAELPALLGQIKLTKNIEKIDGALIHLLGVLRGLGE